MLIFTSHDGKVAFMLFLRNGIINYSIIATILWHFSPNSRLCRTVHNPPSTRFRFFRFLWDIWRSKTPHPACSVTKYAELCFTRWTLWVRKAHSHNDWKFAHYDSKESRELVKFPVLFIVCGESSERKTLRTRSAYVVKLYALRVI